MMKESVTSIRGLFGFSGIGGVVFGLLSLIQSQQDIVSIIIASIILSLGIGFIYSSYKFPEFIHTSTKLVQYLLYVVLGIGVLDLLSAVLQGYSGISLFEPIIRLVIAWYLLLNVKRLEEEHGLHEFEDRRFKYKIKLSL